MKTSEKKTEKKRTRKKLKWWGWFLICLAIAVVGSGSGVMAWALTYSGSGESFVAVANPYNFQGLCVAPTGGEKLVLGELSDAEAISAKAAELYNAACEKNKNAAYFTAYDQCASDFLVAGSLNTIGIRSVIAKTQSEYCRLDFHLADSIPFAEKMGCLMGGAANFNKICKMITGEKAYTDSTMDYLDYVKVCNAVTDEDGVPYSDWTDDAETAAKAVPAYYEGAEGGLAVNSHVINAEGIVSAEILHDSNDGYYIISMVMDVNNPETCRYSNQELVDGSGDKNAHYTKLEIEFTLWENGYFRSMAISEAWIGERLSSTFTSTFEHEWSFSYLASDADVAALIG